jgi:hypothetical protein
MSAPQSSAATTVEDLSGISTAAFGNPYDALIAASEDDPASTLDLDMADLLIFCLD